MRNSNISSTEPQGILTYLSKASHYNNVYSYHVTTGLLCPHFMEPKGSVPHLQVPTTSPYPEPEQSSPRSQPIS
jgi:hypothetical protein